MTTVRVYDDAAPATALEVHDDPNAIARALLPLGVHFEQWPAQEALPSAPTEPEVLAAYRREVDRVMAGRDAGGGYRVVDVVSMIPTHPDREMLRKNFLSEHTHAEDEVRFFVEGRGLFALHVGSRVYEVVCEKGDLLSVPAGTPHWFDMGPSPSFVAIRFFNNPEGWVANYTTSPIADGFSRLAPAPDSP